MTRSVGAIADLRKTASATLPDSRLVYAYVTTTLSIPSDSPMARISRA